MQVDLKEIKARLATVPQFLTLDETVSWDDDYMLAMSIRDDADPNDDRIALHFDEPNDKAVVFLRFAVQAPQDIAALIAEVERLESQAVIMEMHCVRLEANLAESDEARIILSDRASQLRSVLEEITAGCAVSAGIKKHLYE